MNSKLLSHYRFIESNNVTPIFTPTQGYDEMLTSISAAKESVYFAGYCFSPGKLFNRFEKALEGAAKRGVVTYILADHHGSKKTSVSSIERLKRAGAIWVYYRPLNFANAPTYDFRLHKKLLIIDNRLAYTGGLGVDDSWIKKSTRYPRPWSDTHFRVEGRIVNEIQKSFIDSWNAFCPKDYELSFNPEGRDARKGVSIASVDSPPSLSTTAAGDLYLNMIKAAENSIYATTAYFGPPKKLREALKDAAIRGVMVNLIVNGQYNTHHYAAEAGRRWYKELLQSGVKIYEYQPTKIHSKLLTIDNRFTSIGSANFNSRSFYTDAEYNLLIDDKKLSSQIIGDFVKNLASSREISLEDTMKAGMWRRIYRFGVSLARFLY